MLDEIASVPNSQVQTCHLVFTVATGNKAQLLPVLPDSLTSDPMTVLVVTLLLGACIALPANTQKGCSRECILNIYNIHIHIHIYMFININMYII